MYLAFFFCAATSSLSLQLVEFIEEGEGFGGTETDPTMAGVSTPVETQPEIGKRCLKTRVSSQGFCSFRGTDRKIYRYACKKSKQR